MILLILPDAGVWIDHLRRSDPQLIELLAENQIVMHPFIRGEVLLGSVASRRQLGAKLDELPQLDIVAHREVAELIEQLTLWGCGIGYVDVHLLVAARRQPGVSLCTRDKKLRTQAERLRVAADLG